MAAQGADRFEMAFDGGQDLGALALVEIGEAAHGARARGIPIDAVARLAHLRLGQQVGRAIAQPPADHGQQLAGDGVQRIAAHAQRPHAQPRGQNQGGTVAHAMPVSLLRHHIIRESGGFMSYWTQIRGVRPRRYFVRMSLLEAVMRSR